MRRFLKAALTAVILSAAPASAGINIHRDAAGTAAPFLRIAPGGRGTAMGEYQSGLSPDMYGAWWNPAYLSSMRRYRAGACYNRWIQGINNSFVSGVFPLDSGTAGVMFRSLAVPSDMERRSGEGEGDAFFPRSSPEGSFGAYDIMLGLSYGRPVSERVSAGVTLKGILQSIDDRRAYGFGVDAGVLYETSLLGKELGVSSALRNFGPPVKFRKSSYPLPLDFSLGAGMVPADNLEASLNLRVSGDDYPRLHLGAEYILRDTLIFRSGYTYRFKGQPLGGGSGLRAGLGVRISDFSLDYSYAPYSYLGDAHRISLGAEFGSRPVKDISAYTIDLPDPAVSERLSESLPGDAGLFSVSMVPLSISPSRVIWKVEASTGAGFLRRAGFVTSQQNLENIRFKVSEDFTELPDERGGVSRIIYIDISDNLDRRALISSDADFYIGKSSLRSRIKFYDGDLNPLEVLSREASGEEEVFSVDTKGARQILIRQWIRD